MNNKLKVNNKYNSIHFSGCGWLLPYHFGVLTSLKQNNISFDNAWGISAGNFAAAAALNLANLNLGIRQCEDLYKEAKIGFKGNVLELLREYFQYFLNDDAYLHCGDKFNVVCLNLLSKTVTYNTFKDKKEILDSVTAACWIPGVFGLKRRFVNNKVTFDHGAKSNLIAVNKNTIAVSPRPVAKKFRNFYADSTIVAPIHSRFSLKYSLFNKYENICYRSFSYGYEIGIQCIDKPICIMNKEEVYSHYSNIIKEYEGWRN